MAGSAGSRGERSIADLLLFLPRLARLFGRLLADPEVSKLDKGLVIATLAYMASPLDVIPDVLPVIGQVDDLYLAGLVLLRLMNHAGAEKLRAHWDGPEDIVELVSTANRLATAVLPGRVRKVISAAVRRGDLSSLRQD